MMLRHGEKVTSHPCLLRTKETKLLTKEQSPGWLNNSSTKLSTLTGVDTMGLWLCWHCSTLLLLGSLRLSLKLFFSLAKYLCLIVRYCQANSVMRRPMTGFS